MSFVLRGICASAILLMISNVARAGQTSSAAPTPALSPDGSSVPFDPGLLVSSAPTNSSDFSVDSSWRSDIATPSSVSHASPSSVDDPDKSARAKEELIVPLPAIGAGWMLLMGGVLCKIGSRAVRPN